MRFRNLFDRKKKRIVLIIQCRLSSTRLPRKALLPLGGKTVLEWTLQAMKKVKVDRYYLAVDTESADELSGIAKKCGYEFFAGSRDDVLDRFCKVIELSKADVVVRATADNPFLFYEAAQALLDEYKDRCANEGQVDYITWTGLPHGSGVELFDAHSLLKAASMTELAYDHEHVGPALYNHQDSFNSLFLKAPRDFYFPELRTTIDVYGDYRRANALVSVISGSKTVKEPYTAKQILEGLDYDVVKYPILLVPSVQKGHGTGHLRRCLDIAVKTGADILIPGDADLEQCSALVKEAKKKGLHDYQIVQDAEHIDFYSLVVTDLFETEPAVASSLSAAHAVAALDEGSLDTEGVDYLLDIIPSLGAERPVNLVEPGFIELGENVRSSVDKNAVPVKALVVLGGEDPASLTMPAAIALASCGLEVTAIAPQSGDPQAQAGAVPEALQDRLSVTGAVLDLKNQLYTYDLVVTHYGFTAFEAAAAGCAVILLGTTSLHEQLAERYGFASMSAGSVGEEAFKKLLEEPQKLYRDIAWERKVAMPLSNFVVELSKGSRIQCPVCRSQGENGEKLNPVVARTKEHTFRRCRSCGMLYMSWTLSPSQTVYNRAYFYEDYEKQYGKTYEEDFTTIKAQCVRRMNVLDYIYRHRRHYSSVTPTVLDIGCALGPFLDAANDSGWQAFGTDISEDAVSYVKEKLHYPALCASFPQTDIASSFGIDKFDAITMWYVIEHFQNVDEVLSAVSKLLKRGGIFAFSTPSASGVSARYNTQSFFEQSPADHYTLWEPSRTASILKRYGFEVVRIVSTGIHPERFPQAQKPGFNEKSLQARLLRFASKAFRLGDTFEVYCRKETV